MRDAHVVANISWSILEKRKNCIVLLSGAHQRLVSGLRGLVHATTDEFPCEERQDIVYLQVLPVNVFERYE